MNWISVKDKLPEVGQIVVSWMQNHQEPVCVRFEKDEYGDIWYELRDISIDEEMERKDLISHWIPLPEPPKNE